MMWLYVPCESLPSAPEPGDSTSACEWRSLLLARSCTWNTKLRPASSWSRAWKTAPLIRRLYGLISEPSTADRGVAQWIASWAVSPASPTASPASGSEPPTSVTSGPIQPVLSGSVDRSGCSSKMSPAFSTKSIATYAYAAGLVDGEGSIAIMKSSGCYSLTLNIGMSAKGFSVLEWMQRNFGGRIYPRRRATEKWDAAYSWHTFGGTAASIIESLRPYLVLKREHADLALLLRSLMEQAEKRPNGRTYWTPALREQAEGLKLRLNKANEKGPGAHGAGVAWTLFRAEHRIYTNESGQIYDEWVTELRRRSSKLRMSARRTAANGSSSWPTPQVAQAPNKGANQKYLPASLERAAQAMWQTPGTDSLRSRGGERVDEPGLDQQARMWRSPTPTLVDQVLSLPLPTTPKGGQPSSETAPTSRRRLNILFVEWLMNWPEGWTSLAPLGSGSLVTASSRSRLAGPGAS